MKQLIPLFLSFNVIAVMWLVGSKRTIGWALDLVGQVGWLVFIFTFKVWGFLPLVLGLSFVSSRNLWTWYSSDKKEAA